MTELLEEAPSVARSLATDGVRSEVAVADAAHLTILIPAFNEEEGIGRTLDSLLQEKALRGVHIVVVDDGSSDRTAEVAERYPGVRVLRHKNNQGYGAAIKTGTRFAETRYVAWFDADGQHRPVDLIAMFEECVRGNYDAVIGERTRGSDVVKSRVAGKTVLRFAARFVANQPLKDINCGLRVFRRELLVAYLPLLPDGFSASTTSLLVFIKRKRHFCFHPIITEARVGKSTVKQVRDGLRTLHLMMRILFLFSAFKAFALLASLFLVVGIGYGVGWALLTGQGVPVLAAIVVLVGVLILCVGILSDQISALRLDLLERGASADWSERVH